MTSTPDQSICPHSDPPCDICRECVNVAAKDMFGEDAYINNLEGKL